MNKCGNANGVIVLTKQELDFPHYSSKGYGRNRHNGTGWAQNRAGSGVLRFTQSYAITYLTNLRRTDSVITIDAPVHAKVAIMPGYAGEWKTKGGM